MPAWGPFSDLLRTTWEKRAEPETVFHARVVNSDHDFKDGAKMLVTQSQGA